MLKTCVNKYINQIYVKEEYNYVKEGIFKARMIGYRKNYIDKMLTKKVAKQKVYKGGIRKVFPKEYMKEFIKNIEIHKRMYKEMCKKVYKRMLKGCVE